MAKTTKTRRHIPLLRTDARPDETAASYDTGIVSISSGNVKTGKIPSVSLPPFTTCRKNAPCCRECYVNNYLFKPSVVNAYNRNLAIYLTSTFDFFRQISTACRMFRYFRWHVSGDIPDAVYFNGMLQVARENPHCSFLAFTKQYEIINNYIDQNPDGIPENLTIVLSNWFDWQCENPHNLPTTTVFNDGDEIPDNWKICSGNCIECCCRGIGCWELKNGEILAFKKH